MGVVTVVVACLYHLDVSLRHAGFLGEFLFQEVENELQVAAEEPAHQAKREHIAALQHRFVVHTAVCQRVLHHLGYRALYHAVRVYAHLPEVVGGLKLRLVEVRLLEGVGVYDDGSLWFRILILRLQCRRVHRDEHVALVAGGEHLASAYVYLEARHTCERALRSPYVRWIIRERRDTVAHGSGYRGEDVAGELHSVARIT